MMPLCAECGRVAKLFPVFDKQGLMRRLCWECYQKYHKAKVQKLKDGRTQLEGFTEKYKDVPTIDIDGNITKKADEKAE